MRTDFKEILESYVVCLQARMTRFQKNNELGKWDADSIEWFQKVEIELGGMRKLMHLTDREVSSLTKYASGINHFPQIRTRVIFHSPYPNTDRQTLNGKEAVVTEVTENRPSYPLGIAICIEFLDDHRKTWVDINEIDW